MNISGRLVEKSNYTTNPIFYWLILTSFIDIKIEWMWCSSGADGFTNGFYGQNESCMMCPFIYDTVDYGYSWQIGGDEWWYYKPDFRLVDSCPPLLMSISGECVGAVALQRSEMESTVNFYLATFLVFEICTQLRLYWLY